MQERRKHRRLPVIKDLAEPVELMILDSSHNGHAESRIVPGVLTNLSAGGMDLVLLGPVTGRPTFKMNLHLPGFDRFEVEGKFVWSRPKGNTSIVGIQFTKIDSDHAKQLSHMADAYWECEERIRMKSSTVCFHGCAYWELCGKPAKLKSPSVGGITEKARR